ncbi:MAG TPA: aminotransferase class V-fold PLP-dependent enzyme [Asticcacaulis sp.]|nr:aminotransferase class V-fold PLP-dependent enzyme [Asticcacaulis sp.]
MAEPLYLDHAATSPLRPEARDAMLRAYEMGGNASSVHAIGRKAKVAMEDARASILRNLEGMDVGRLVFTSGGTEANALALNQARDYDYIVVSEGEHDSIYVGANAIGKPVIRLPLTANGDADLAALERILKENVGRAFVCVMLVNNETGAISCVGRLVYEHGGWLHIDGVAGKGGFYFDSLDADSVSLSAHKIGGPQGVGALIHHSNHALKPLLIGGGQELGQRAGTENVPGIVAFAAALDACRPFDPAVVAAQAEVEALLKSRGATILGEGASRAPGMLYIAQPDWASNLQLIHMDMAGICVSSGSACSSGKVKSSRVVAAMGYPELADKALRISAGWTTKPEDWHRFYDVWSAGYDDYLKRRVRAHTKEQA